MAPPTRRQPRLSIWCQPKLLDLTPQAGFEPATLRLTEATPKIDHVRRMMMKMMKISNLRVASDPASIAIAHFVNDGKIASFSEGYVTINVTPQPL
jgi:hypothetical protein